MQTAAAATLTGCAADSAARQPSTEGSATDLETTVAALVAGADLKWVDSVLGAPPQSARTGDLATTPSSTLGATLVVAKGCLVAGDGGGGVFYWKPSADTDDGGTFIVPGGSRGSSGAGWKRIFSGGLDARWFGARGNTDAGNNDTVALQAALDRGAATQQTVVLAAGRYPVQNLRVKNGLRALTGPGTLVAMGYYGQAVLELDGQFFATPAVQGCTFSGFGIDCAAVAHCAIFAATAMGCSFRELSISGLTVDSGGDTAIWLHFGSCQNSVYANRIVLLENPTGDVRGVFVLGKSVDPYNGYFANGGSFSEPLTPCYENDISENYVFGGSHGIAINNASRNTVRGNRMMRQRDRSIILCPLARYNTVIGNVCQDFKSSGVHLAYGASNNIISDNICTSYLTSGEAGLQAYVGCNENVFANNLVECTSNYGVYIGVGSQGNRVYGNRIRGYRRCAIAVESEWRDADPSVYSRPNFGPAPSGGSWAYVGSSLNVIESNVIGDPSQAPAAAILLGQVGSATLSGTVIRDNMIQTTSIAHLLYLLEETPGALSGCLLRGNDTAGAPPSKVVLPRGRGHFRRVEGDETLNGASYAFSANDTTPSVAIGDGFLCLNSGPTTVTYFDDGADEQELTLRTDIHTTIKHDSAKIRLKGGVDITGVNANCFVRFRRVSGIWMEISRNW
jgi:parallel beta-helix repeat protein